MQCCQPDRLSPPFNAGSVAMLQTRLSLSFLECKQHRKRSCVFPTPIILITCYPLSLGVSYPSFFPSLHLFFLFIPSFRLPFPLPNYLSLSLSHFLRFSIVLYLLVSPVSFFINPFSFLTSIFSFHLSSFSLSLSPFFLLSSPSFSLFSLPSLPSPSPFSPSHASPLITSCLLPVFSLLLSSFLFPVSVPFFCLFVRLLLLSFSSLCCQSFFSFFCLFLSLSIFSLRHPFHFSSCLCPQFFCLFPFRLLLLSFSLSMPVSLISLLFFASSFSFSIFFPFPSLPYPPPLFTPYPSSFFLSPLLLFSLAPLYPLPLFFSPPYHPTFFPSPPYPPSLISSLPYSFPLPFLPYSPSLFDSLSIILSPPSVFPIWLPSSLLFCTPFLPSFLFIPSPSFLLFPLLLLLVSFPLLFLLFPTPSFLPSLSLPLLFLSYVFPLLFLSSVPSSLSLSCSSSLLVSIILLPLLFSSVPPFFSFLCVSCSLFTSPLYHPPSLFSSLPYPPSFLLSLRILFPLHFSSLSSSPYSFSSFRKSTNENG
ncbi:hypothetical protein C7M84_020550 [Penaeus vannamei]|uniref:Uncharacterized protein n=1 Tax=Penaeus vannamei TaxID=6689 RepID=A0A423SBP8_PENVA|nr:hypothetical protein C7M84_020550 [Penaeus vannamei]